MTEYAATATASAPSPDPGRPPSRTLLALVGALAGFVLAATLLIDPLGLHHLDERLRGETVSAEMAAVSPDEGSGDGQLWTCGMHPQVIRDQPGSCPICKMDLTPLDTSGLDMGGQDHTGHDHTRPTETEVWVCPMHPEIAEDAPGECPICGMDLVAKTLEPSAPAGGGTTIRIDPSVVQKMNVRTAVVERRDLYHPIRTVGYLEYDQERMVTVTTKYGGWVEAVHVNNVGEAVRKGQPLFEIYSPELVQTQQELLSAVTFAQRLHDAEADLDAIRRAEALLDASRTRLRYWDVSDEQVARLEASGEVFRTLAVKAPAGGVVMRRMAGLEGMAVKPGMEVYHLADLSTLWLVVEVFEDQIAWIREGTPAEVSFTYFPGESFDGRVRYIEPALSERTRTLRVKIAMPNPAGRLRTGMYATVVFGPRAAEAVLAVPSEAVLRTGSRQVAVVDLGGGAFTPRPVVLGHEAEGWVEILDGLDEGERVVTSAQFLIDSEASVREAIAKMLAQGRDEVPADVSGGGHVH